MSHAIKMRDLAEKLVAGDARELGNSGAKPATLDVCEKLRPQLVTFMGNAGTRALLARGLALAGGEVHWLRAIHVRADGSLEGMTELSGQLTPEDLAEGRAVLLAQMLELLVGFIGEKLTMRLIQDVWPNVPLEGKDFTKGEKAKGVI